MSQSDIIQALKKKRKPLTSRELSEIIRVNQENVLRALRKLIQNKEVGFRNLSKEEAKKFGFKKIPSRFFVYYLILEKEKNKKDFE